MAYSRDYGTKIEWENFPSTNTAVDADNLGKMDYAIFEHDKKIVELDGRVETVKESVTEDVAQAKEYADLSKDYALESKNFSEQSAEHATTAYNEAERAKFYADTVQEGITTTTDRELTESQAGGIRIISMDGESQQNGTPTPEAPIDIDSVEVSEIWTHGKNLYDEVANNVEINHSGIKFTKNEYGNLTLSGTTTASINAVMNPFTLPAGTYYYQKGTVKNVSVRLYNRTASAFIAYDNGSFTLAKESKLDVRVQSNSGSAISGTIKIQIEKGSTMTKYEPYTATKATLSAPIVLRGIGDAKDVLCKQNGVYGILRRPKKYEFASIRAFLNSTNTIRQFADVSDYVGGYNLAILCNRLIAKDIYSVDKEGIMLFNTGSGYVFVIRLPKSVLSAETQDAFLAYLKENVEVYYIAEPTFEPLPLADQIALHKLETFGGVTYLFTDSTIEPIIEVEYGTSKVGGYAIKGLNNGEISLLELEQLKTLTNELATQLVAGSEA